MSNPFAHLHVHSEHSLRYATARVRELVRAAVEHGMDSVALTDSDGLYGVPDLLWWARRQGIRPVVGCSVAVGLTETPTPRATSRLVLLARDAGGYRNLCHLVTSAHAASSERPYVDLDVLKELSGGLVVICSGPAAPVIADLADGEWARARQTARRLADSVESNESLYLAVQQHGCHLPGGVSETELNTRVSILAEELGIGVVATNDVRYQRPEDAEVRNLIARWSARNRGRAVDHAVDSDQFYFKSADEMTVSLPDFPDAIAAAGRIADMCDVELGPQTHIPVAFPEAESRIDQLRSLCETGLLNRYGESSPAMVQARLDEELELVRRHDLCDYILFLADLAEALAAAGVEVGPGRGSMPSSIILYLLGLTSVDPCEYGLIFEKWLGTHRPHPRPLTSLDVELGSTTSIVEYLRHRYGEHAAALNLRDGKLQGEAAAQRAAAILSSTGANLQTVLETIERGRWGLIDWTACATSLAKVGDGASVAVTPVTRIAWVAGSLQNLVDSRASIGDWWNPCWITACDGDLRDLAPLERQQSEGPVIQYESWGMDDVGAAQLSVTELQTLSVLKRARNNVLDQCASTLNLNRIPLDDPMTYDLFCSGDTSGVYMFEAPTLRSVLVELMPGSFEDLVIAAAFDSPSFGESELGIEYLRRRRSGWDEDIHPDLAPIIGSTYGLFLFHEQLMHVWHRLSGLSFDWCDGLRRAHFKLHRDQIAQARYEWFEAGTSKGRPVELLSQVWDDTARWAAHAFPKSHGVAQALLGYRCAYVKAHFPRPFLKAHQQTQGLDAFWRFDVDYHYKHGE